MKDRFVDFIFTIRDHETKEEVKLVIPSMGYSAVMFDNMIEILRRSKKTMIKKLENKLKK